MPRIFLPPKLQEMREWWQLYPDENVRRLLLEVHRARKTLQKLQKLASDLEEIGGLHDYLEKQRRNEPRRKLLVRISAELDRVGDIEDKLRLKLEERLRRERQLFNEIERNGVEYRQMLSRDADKL